MKSAQSSASSDVSTRESRDREHTDSGDINCLIHVISPCHIKQEIDDDMSDYKTNDVVAVQNGGMLTSNKLVMDQNNSGSMNEKDITFNPPVSHVIRPCHIKQEKDDDISDKTNDMVTIQSDDMLAANKIKSEQNSSCSVEEKDILFNPPVSKSNVTDKYGQPLAQSIPGNKILRVGQKDFMVMNQNESVDGPPYQCNICTRSFTTLVALQIHKQNHVVKEPFSCDFCSKRFAQLYNLKAHMQSHTGEKPYACNTCNKCYTSLFNLQMHVKTHTKEKLYPCDICNKHYSSSSYLKRHKQIHMGEIQKAYSCSNCSKCFTTSTNLKIHMRTHTGEQPYPCSKCTKCFTQLCNLKTHMRTHTGEQPYICSKCTKCFTTSASLNMHMGTHT